MIFFNKTNTSPTLRALGPNVNHIEIYAVYGGRLSGYGLNRGSATHDGAAVTTQIQKPELPMAVPHIKVMPRNRKIAFDKQAAQALGTTVGKVGNYQAELHHYRVRERWR